MRRRLAALLAVVASGCTSYSGVLTTETWTELSPQQAVAPIQPRLEAIANPITRAPRMRGGCSTSVRKEGDVLVIPDAHPREVYCASIAPFGLTVLELPAGVTLSSAQSGMGGYVHVTSADAGGRLAVSVESSCIPQRRENGTIVPPEIYERVEPSSLPFCPQSHTDLALMTSEGPIYFRLALNESTRTRAVDIRSDPLVERAAPKIPVRTPAAQDLYATSVDGAVVPWTPDDAWADGWQTVIVWHRPMPTLPGLHVGVGGEQMGAAPAVIHDEAAIALVYPHRLTEFELRMDTRRLRFSATPQGDAR